MSDSLHTEELLRKQMEGAELSPSPESWNLIRRKLRWKQFMRFHYGRFNIYYAVALLLTAVGAVLILRGEPALSEESKGQSNMDSEIKSEGQTAVIEEELSTRDKERQNTENPLDETPSTLEDGVSLTHRGAGLKSKALPDSDQIQSGTPEREASPSSPEKVHVAPLPTKGPIEGKQIIQAPSGQIKCSVRSGCVPLTVQFSSMKANATSLQWDFGNGEESSEADPVFHFTEPGSYKVSLSTLNNSGEKEVSTVSIEVLPAPVADFQVEEGLEGLDNHVVLNLLNYSSGAATYTWNLIDREGRQCTWTSQEYQPTIGIKDLSTESRKLSLEVINEFGCSDTDIQQLPVIVESSDTRIKFPTAFSPNPSGPGNGQFSPGAKRIDLFYPVYIEVPAEYHMKVFARRGELLFETRDVYQGWDGYIKQERAPGDVYVWMVEGIWADGLPFSYRGDVTVIWSQYW